MAEISASQYGQQRGITKQRISAAVKKGQLDKCMKRNADGTLWRDPRTQGLMLDPQIADVEWAKNVGHHPNGKNLDAPPATTTGPENSPTASAIAGAPTVQSMPPPAPRNGKFMENRTTREQYMAELARLDYEERTGKLVRAEDVTQLMEKIVSETKTRILAVPGKAKSLIPHMKTDDVLTMDKLLREALTELSNVRPVQHQ